MGKRIFVTGATGLVAHRLIPELAAQGHEVIGLARTEDGAGIVRSLGATPIVGTMADVQILREGARGAEVVFHLAGGLRGAGKETAEVLNAEGTRHLIEALSDNSKVESVVYPSTCAVYGDRSGLWVGEDMPPHPHTAYGQSKVDAEAALFEAHERRALPVRIVRLASVYGPKAPFLLADAIRKGRAWLPGEGRNHLPVIHVDDAAMGLIAVAERGQDGAIYNLAAPEAPMLKDFYAEVHRCVGGKPVRFWSTWVPSYVQQGLARRNERIAARLGRKPRFTPDVLKLFTYSVRMRVERLEKDLGFTWKWPTHKDGIADAVGRA